MAKRDSDKKRGWRSLLILLAVVIGLLACNQLGLSEEDVEAILDEAITIIEEESTRQAAVAVEPVSGEWYRLYFTTPHYPDEPATRVENIQQGLIEAINSAQKRLDIAIYELDLEDVGDAILAARDRGVEVRIVTDSDTLEEDETLIRLDKADLPVVPDERGAIMHNKFVVVDDLAVWTGSWNFTVNGTFRNNNNAIYIHSVELARNYTAEFEEMFSREEFGPTSTADTPAPQVKLGETLIEVCFAPEDECGQKLVELAGQAEQSIHFMAFSFTHDELGQTMRSRAKEGVAVHGVFETRGSEIEYSEYGRMKRQGLDVVQDGNPYTMHHKVIIVDEQIVVLGSFNFSGNADESNDENILIIHHPEIAAQYLAEFQRVYETALNPPNE